MSEDTQAVVAKIKQQVEENPLILYMKGTPYFPQCGFSSQVAYILELCGVKDYAHVNILENPDIRANISHYSNWPTFPQLFVNGKLIGGCDIVTKEYQEGRLKPLLQKELGITASGE